MTRTLLALSFLAVALLPADAAPRAITIKMTEPLRFDPLQIEVTPSEELILKIRNTDSTEQPHNFVLAKPGSQKALVELALTLGAEGPDRDYLPESDTILVHSKLLTPGGKENIAFTAPAEAGIYPYVCTFPGHGFLMYGALYVGVKAPPLEKDPNIPPSAVQFLKEKNAPAKSGEIARPAVQRMFLPDAGPAAIAVALPGTLNYCWDAGACKLRSFWRGDFIDATPSWRGNGNALAKINGSPIWSEAVASFPLDFGSEGKVKFEGYQLAEGLPRFHYRVDGISVIETITPKPDGSGILRHFEISGAESPIRLRVAAPESLVLRCDAGRAIASGFEIPVASAKSFTLEMSAP